MRSNGPAMRPDEIDMAPRWATIGTAVPRWAVGPSARWRMGSRRWRAGSRCRILDSRCCFSDTPPRERENMNTTGKFADVIFWTPDVVVRARDVLCWAQWVHAWSRWKPHIWSAQLCMGAIMAQLWNSYGALWRCYGEAVGNDWQAMGKLWEFMGRLWRRYGRPCRSYGEAMRGYGGTMEKLCEAMPMQWGSYGKLW